MRVRRRFAVQIKLEQQARIGWAQRIERGKQQGKNDKPGDAGCQFRAPGRNRGAQHSLSADIMPLTLTFLKRKALTLLERA